ncbi:hypothetical protein BATDEDRAFT_91149 [Batrachochytrium dendrobatidis JAM81]|uniref:U3 small nucleolar RNA-associated protein 15 C-terminal domain-containing protein n=2 Tax=Batrachochytrium dendrobatidis TaxID=109871 RepID=F4PAB1_BATDJ|nr:snoRNA-binding rRNA-processing protein UTP15 [Batrachochytrium dendrobatidis JAM81]EGF77898.1 hypothetical protein BATDEDRAFT_91149 [Batrachochytrium dendrobatidis JAM81]KAJ8330081.1 U3 small nucleolar RNA-associated protein 15 [Batrachochytrium dendrobatidis]KAK5670499.1 U3 small nucleolar RNA-associated protein 15 [Batrachochytrium dendrobatidis]OAJ44143.1 hypothetical protein BDEG_27409 [Batrachochytrium dendrobatidis JEL423]|eukprot:XP_006681501.1 hypothetical protein BATDEDRAFT_91149 [Batrachochytrium dendrobatidis JAM81]
MSDYTKLPIHQFPKVAGRVTDDTAYWSKLKSPVIIKEFSSINSVQFSPHSPHDFCISSSTRVQIYSATTQSVKKTISRFKDVVHCASIRHDNKLLIAGDASGLVQIFELNSRAILRTLAGHKAAVHAAEFCPNDTSKVLTCSDDKTCVVWDVPTQMQTSVFSEHTDYVRSAIAMPDNDTLFMTGSYDHTVKLWDTRSPDASTMTMNHGSPIEAILRLPGGGLVASAGGNRIKIWDILSGGKLLHSFSNHQKAITSLCLDSTNSFLISGALDHHVKIVSLEDYKIVHSLKYSAPILSLGISPTNSQLVVGMSSGLLSIRQRAVRSEDIAKKQDVQTHNGTYQYYIRGSNYTPDENDTRIESKTKARLQSYDKLLKGFQYANALDAVLEGPPKPLLIISMLEELIHRDGLRAALAGRDEHTLQRILSFLMRYISNPRYTVLLTDVSNTILDIYSLVLGHSQIIGELLKKLKFKVHEEIQLDYRLGEVIGLMDTLMSMSVRE